jgi:hypothetical protein
LFSCVVGGAQAPPAYAYAAQAQQMPMVVAPSVAESGKLYISNLDYNVSNEDIKVRNL